MNAVNFADRRGLLQAGLGTVAAAMAIPGAAMAGGLDGAVSTASWLKVDILSRRLERLTHAQYLAHWRDVHAPLFRSQPIVKQYVRRYIQSRIIDDRPRGLFNSSVDGVVQLWFDDMDGYKAFYASDNYRDVIQPDEQRFTDADRSEMIFTHETVIIG